MHSGLLAHNVFDVCIYHANCPDGFGAAWAVHKAQGARAFESGHSLEPVSLSKYKGRSLLLVDYCWGLDTLKEVLKVARRVTVIGHHKTALSQVGDFKHPRFSAFFDMNHSGAMLTWKAFHEESAPALIQHIEDYDLFRHRLPGTNELNLALTAVPFDFEVWDSLDVDELKAEGAAISRWVSAQVDRLATSAGMATLEGHVVPCVHAPRCFVDRLGHKLAEGHPFSIVWAETKHAVHFSLRSMDDGMVVNAIAERFGGRGHEHAAVFSLPRGSAEVGQILGYALQDSED
jgi:uncharacterized protein